MLIRNFVIPKMQKKTDRNESKNPFSGIESIIPGIFIKSGIKNELILV